MEKFFINSNQIQDTIITIVNNDAKHIKKVLRKKINDIILVSDDLGKTYECSIIEINEQDVVCKILNENEENNENNIELVLYQCIAKSDKMDYIIQKATELGVNEIVPIISNRVIVKLDEQDKLKRVQRWQKIADEASKQCKRTKLPKVENVFFLSNICNIISNCDIILLAYENSKEKLKEYFMQNNLCNSKRVGIIIGPEGGFDESEVELLKQINNLKVVSLGKRILRTETASIVLLSSILYEVGEI